MLATQSQKAGGQSLLYHRDWGSRRRLFAPASRAPALDGRPLMAPPADFFALVLRGDLEPIELPGGSSFLSIAADSLPEPAQANAFQPAGESSRACGLCVLSRGQSVWSWPGSCPFPETEVNHAKSVEYFVGPRSPARGRRVRERPAARGQDRAPRHGRQRDVGAGREGRQVGSLLDRDDPVEGWTHTSGVEGRRQGPFRVHEQRRQDVPDGASADTKSRSRLTARRRHGKGALARPLFSWGRRRGPPVRRLA